MGRCLVKPYRDCGCTKPGHLVWGSSGCSSNDRSKKPYNESWEFGIHQRRTGKNDPPPGCWLWRYLKILPPGYGGHLYLVVLYEDSKGTEYRLADRLFHRV